MNIRIILSALFIVFSLFDSIGQCSEDINISSQEELDRFNRSNDCKIVKGHVTLSGNFSDLSGLKLEQVGSITIKNTNLQNLTGLEKLNIIDDDFIITGNQELLSISAITNLVKIGRNIKIEYNSKIKNAKLPPIEKIKNLEINNNSSLESIIEPNVLIESYDINISGNPALKTISGFDNLESVEESFSTHYLPNLESIGDFNNLKQVKVIRLKDTKLEKTPAWENLTTIELLIPLP